MKKSSSVICNYCTIHESNRMTFTIHGTHMHKETYRTNILSSTVTAYFYTYFTKNYDTCHLPTFKLHHFPNKGTKLKKQMRYLGTGNLVETWYPWMTYNTQKSKTCRKQAHNCLHRFNRTTATYTEVYLLGDTNVMIQTGTKLTYTILQKFKTPVSNKSRT